jgi:serine/threonine-protein kinase
VAATGNGPGRGGPTALVGVTISDRYKIERLLGEGGMGAVYQAEHVLMRKRMAIKVLHPEMTRLPEVVQRFEREAMAAAHIDHPHVVAATDFGKLDDGSFFLALEYVEGKSLRDVIGQGRLELGRALHIGRQMAAALSRAHQLKIVHRDLKPENVMLVERDGDTDFVKVLDFGIAKVQIGELTADNEKSAGPGQQILTQAGMVYGTPEYMAPEQALGQPVDHKVDLYALGCIMYEMLCGVRPFDADSKVALLGMQVTAPVPSMATKAPDANVPPEVEALVKRLLAKEASERLGDARELVENITGILGQLVLAGRIDDSYSPPASRLITGSGHFAALSSPSSPELIAAANAASLAGTGPKVRVAPALEGLLARKAWVIAAGLGLVGILVLGVTIVVAKGNSEVKDEHEGGTVAVVVDAAAPPVASPSVEQKIGDAISQIDKGNYGSGIEALTSLGADAEGREDVHHALWKAYSQTNRPKEAMHEVGQLMAADPNFKLLDAEGITLRTSVRDTALREGQAGADKAAVDEAYNLLSSGRLGTIGLDDLYDIGNGKAGVNYPKASSRALREIVKADRAKMSPSLAVTADILAVTGDRPNCPAIKNQLDHAVEKGDERTLLLLRTLTQPRWVRVGHWNKQANALGCIHEGSLTQAIADLETRLKKK